jgi:TatD DNase family protein
MKMKIIDTHTHMYFGTFEEDRDDVMKACADAGVVEMIHIGCDEMSCLAAIECARKYGQKVVLGLHPCDVDKIGTKMEYHRYAGMEAYELVCKTPEDFFAWVEDLYLKNKDIVVGWGETGFDLYHRNTPELHDLQKKCTLEHLRLAQKYDLPVVFHVRDAMAELFATLDEWYAKNGAVRGVVHSFSEDLDAAQQIVEKYGLHIGVGGLATYKTAEKTREAIASVPMEMLLTETDAPFLAPKKAKKSGVRRNSPQFLAEVVEMIAETKQMDTEECGEALVENARELFGLE